MVIFTYVLLWWITGFTGALWVIWVLETSQPNKNWTVGHLFCSVFAGIFGLFVWITGGLIVADGTDFWNRPLFKRKEPTNDTKKRKWAKL
jgi:uncharacterized membrane-anchored protein YitT (DUF2179 family)